MQFSIALFSGELIVNHKIMTLIVSENHSETQVNVKSIVDRVLKFQKPETINGLNEISLVDNHQEDIAFGCYKKSARKIEIYVEPTIEWIPWILKKTYLFPYLVIATTLAHELDHHVNRDNDQIDREKSAQENVMKYVYPSLGIFKPMAKIISKILFTFKKNG